MTNASELLLNTVMNNKPKMLTGLNQKVCGRLPFIRFGGTRTSWPPVERQGLTHLVTQVNHGKPVSLPFGAGRPQGMLLAVRVKECGESECRPV